jgi:uncharacterized cupredoxin-like copper-binding protein
MKGYVIKANTRNQRATRRGLRRLTVVGATLAVLVTGACGSTETANPSAGGAKPSDAVHNAVPAVFADDAYLENKGDFIDAASKTWDATKKEVKIELAEMSFTPKDLPLEAGKPYEISLVNVGKEKHEFTASKFFRSAAIRKVENDGAEVKAPFFTEIEVKAGKTVKLFVIPVTTGSFETLCEIPGHLEAGMKGTITVTGTKPATPVEKLGTLKTGAWVTGGPALVEAASKTWDATAAKVTIEAGEDGGKMFFKKKDTVLKVGVPAQIKLVNVGTQKHEWSSEDFFPTMAFRKAEDAFGEYKALRLDEAEVLKGGTLELFVIPTKAGTFDIVCAIPGHKEAGMFGTITVTK